MKKIINQNNEMSKLYQWTPSSFEFLCHGDEEFLSLDTQLDNINDEFVHYVKLWQYKLNLPVAGLMNRATFKAILKKFKHNWTHHIIFDGVPYPITGCKIRNPWHGTSHFMPSLTHAKKQAISNVTIENRIISPSGIVIHDFPATEFKQAWLVYTGKYMMFSKHPERFNGKMPTYSPAFCVDPNGCIHQLIDPFRWMTYHVDYSTGCFNDHTIGIDMLNYLNPRHFPKWMERFQEIGTIRAKRSKSVSTRKYLRPTTEQMNSTKALVITLSNLVTSEPEYIIDVSESEDGSGLTELQLRRHKVDAREPMIVAHGQLQTKRWDGYAFLNELFLQGDLI